MMKESGQMVKGCWEMMPLLVSQYYAILMKLIVLNTYSLQLFVIRMMPSLQCFDIKHKTNKTFPTNNNHSTYMVQNYRSSKLCDTNPSTQRLCA